MKNFESKRQHTRIGAAVSRDIANFQRQLWAERHPGPLPGIDHPIPRLSLARDSRVVSVSARIDAFVKERVCALAGVVSALAVLALGTGCTVIGYTGPNGERFSRQCFGTSSAITSLQVETGTNGVRRIELQGYRSDSADAIGAVTEAAVRGVISKSAVAP